MVYYDNLRVTEYKEARSDINQGGYKYLIAGTTAYEAFVTDKGFREWLARTKLKLEQIQVDEELEYLNISKIYRVLGVIKEVLFWTMDEVPKDATHFKGLSNGSLVDCYCKPVTQGAIIFRPNPNAKDVYKPMPINEHIAYQKIHG